ncbi:heat-inducible transcriptional repressor HrcA [Alkalicaulis satelles]|uniref:Heat-inducible transcription repressor HrcA n=1 Tax=Alkalicaulis satelles TaxID=2609175 RepID=A0A5M6ZKQ4_9PROT|nr:heat-inducible transcriptional repressor HrcA [Alkalicaulis satelles]KAA5803798.1 heat-inducible transcriptional repressor HrcA [Alkalicaulis satelles]
MSDPVRLPSLAELDARSRDVFRELVETYLDTGEPVGSRTLSRKGAFTLSPASIRNTMADLASAGLLTAPHASAGRMPTHAGLRLFVDGLLQIGDLDSDDRREIDERVAAAGRRTEDVLGEASTLLSGLAGGAGLVASPASEAPLRHVEFVTLAPGEVLAVLVSEGGSVENRLMRAPSGLPPAALIEAGNYLSARLRGRTLAEALAEIQTEIAERRAQLDEAAAELVEQGVADWSGPETRQLIVRGQARLLESVEAAGDLERIRMLFEDIERKEGLLALLDEARNGQGVRLFIGSENPLFSLSGSSVIVAPYRNRDNRIIGAIGVIGPTRLNYARVIPLVDYTARVVGRLLASR